MKFRSVAKKFAPRINVKHAVFALAAAPLAAFADGTGAPDVSTVVAAIVAGGVAIALIGNAKSGVQAVMALWGMIKGAIGRG
ncbi:major capsid protein [Chromobacterium subtsugae]|uniref:major capsid protein n=1 Tax=Chromobacterium subtsugae TaxID=251747 RepID=UPI0007F86D6B|nr:major capsid protein [Chromobacterium subtsugae]OBU86842.1 hypothetical protein MY55_08555 [Chromobacterium subtsugae]